MVIEIDEGYQFIYLLYLSTLALAKFIKTRVSC